MSVRVTYLPKKFSFLIDWQIFGILIIQVLDASDELVMIILNASLGARWSNIVEFNTLDAINILLKILPQLIHEVTQFVGISEVC